MGLEFDLTIGKTNAFDYDKKYDFIVIGGGPAGLSAALYAKRKGLAVAVVSENPGGQVVDTSSVENYLGIESVSGETLASQFKNHVESYEVPFLEGQSVIKVENRKKDEQRIYLDNDKMLQSRTILIATGSKNRKLHVPGEEEFYGKGVTYCAICDGPLFEGFDVAVAGGGNSAVEAAIDLSKIASSVKLIQRSVLRADQVLIDKLKTLENVSIYLGYQIRAIKGKKLVEEVVAYDQEKKQEVALKTSAVFVEIGYVPNSKVVKDLVELNNRGEIVVNAKNETSVEGIYAAGDVTDVPYKQIVIAASEGAKAALSATDFLNKN